jgi:hypothetical protein
MTRKVQLGVIHLPSTTLAPDEPVESTCNSDAAACSLASSMLRRVSLVLTPPPIPTSLHPLSLALNMSSFSAAPPVSPKLKQLMNEADLLMRVFRYEQAYLLYHQVYERLVVSHGEDHPLALNVRFNMRLDDSI